MNTRNFFRAATCRAARTELSSALAEAQAETREGAVFERLVTAHSRAFSAASAAAHLPSGAHCMEVVEQAEKWMNREGISFYR